MSRKPKKLKILLTGGGTGGHIYPLIAVSRELMKLSIESGFDPDLRYFGEAGSFRFNLEDNDIKVVHITASKLRRYASIQNFFDIFRFCFGTMQSLWKVFWFMPQAAFSKGGPGALSVITACRFYFVPLVIHESDAVPGLTNRFSAKTARIVELAFESAEKFFNPKKVHLVGNPVRDEILMIGEMPMAKAELGFDPRSPVIFVIGGSQGAEKLNDFVFENIERLTEKFQILHQVGAANFTSYKNEFIFLYGKDERLKSRYNFQPYFDRNIGQAYAAADLIISRAGAGTIFEAAATGKPSILIPLPESANNHQVENAYEYERAGGGLVIEEENLTAGVVIDATLKILGNPELYQKMSEAAKRFYQPNSAKVIAHDILFRVLGV